MPDQDGEVYLVQYMNGNVESRVLNPILLDIDAIDKMFNDTKPYKYDGICRKYSHLYRTPIARQGFSLEDKLAAFDMKVLQELLTTNYN